MNPFPTLAVLLLACAPALAQDPAPAPEDDELTPAQAMELLKEAHEMMGKAEELLGDSSRGQALETERELLENLKREFKDDPALLQEQVLEKIRKMIARAEKRQKDVVDKLAEILRKAKASSGGGKGPASEQQPKDGASKPKNPSGPAAKPYDPNRTDDASKFRSRADKTGSWGNLPPAARAAMLAGEKAELPPEFLEQWKEYSEMLQGRNK